MEIEEDTCGEYDGIHIVLNCTCDLVPIEHLGDVPPPSIDDSPDMQVLYEESVRRRKERQWIKACEVEEITQMEEWDFKLVQFRGGLSLHVDTNEPRQTRSQTKTHLRDTYGIDDWKWAQEEKRARKFFKDLHSKVKKNDCKYPGELLNDGSGWIRYRPTYKELPRTLPHGDTGYGPRKLWMDTYTNHKRAWHAAGLFEIHTHMNVFALDTMIYKTCLSLTAEKVMHDLSLADQFSDIGTPILRKEVSLLQIRTVKVSNLSRKATVRDIYDFFSFSGVIESIDVQSDEDGLKVAFVTFRDSESLDTVVLLSGATIVDQIVSITEVEDTHPSAGANSATPALAQQVLVT